MTGKELILKAMNLKEVERIPWVPFAGVHAATLINENATDFLKRSDLIVNGLDEVVKRYSPDGLPLVFDLQIEAEIFGCDLNWSDDNPPAVVSHPLSDGTSNLEDLSVPTIADGRLPVIIDALKRTRERHPDIALYGLITGPFTLALHLLGTDIFMGMFDRPDHVRDVLSFCAETAKFMADVYIDGGADVIAVVDPMTSQIGPDQFREFCAQPATAVFDHIRSRGSKGSFFVCGHAQNNIEAMTECHCDGLSIDENIPLDYVKDVCLKKNISFGGNMKLTTVMLLGKPDDNKVEAMQCMEIGGFKGFILAPGCDMPFATPPNNVEAIAQVVHDDYQRQIAKELSQREKTPDQLLDMTDYGQGDKVIIDVITLDSEACAPCQYMVEAVKSVIPEFGDLIEWREHKIKHPESVTLMSSLYVRNIPTICVDGKIKFVSKIPPRDELVKAILARIREKFSLKINYRRGKILLLGNPEDRAYQESKENIELALKELGSDVSLEEVNEDADVKKYGVFKTPAVVTERHFVKSVGKIADKTAVKEWIKALSE